jgi:hypothetical protein
MMEPISVWTVCALMSRKPKALRENLPFINQAVGADETLIMSADLHWIFLAKGVAGLLVSVFISSLIDTYSGEWMLSLHDQDKTDLSFIVFRLSNILQYFFIALGVILFLIYCATFMTTKVALTTRRLMLRKGILFVKLNNIDLEEIKGEYVDHGMLGRFFNYGEIHMDARFVQNFYVPNIADPYRLLRAINESRAVSGDTVVAGDVALTPSLAVVETPEIKTEQVYVPVPPEPEPPALVATPVVPAPVESVAVVHAAPPAPGAGVVAAPQVPQAPVAPIQQPIQQIVKETPPMTQPVITHVVVQPADGSAPIAVAVAAPPEQIGVPPTPVPAAAPLQVDSLAIPPEELAKINVTPEPKTAQSVDELESVSETFSEIAETPSETVLDETDEYIVIKKKKT